VSNRDPQCSGPVPQDMLETIMNGIFAFAMTIIVKNNIPLPPEGMTEDIQFLVSYFLSIFFDGFSFIFTFFILALFYVLVFEIMRHIKKVDRFFVYFMFAFLLSIVFIPLTSLLWSISDVPIPYGILFHTNIIISGILLYGLWNYACRDKNILTLDTREEYTKNLSFRIGMFPATAILGLLIDGQEISFELAPTILLYLIPIAICIAYSKD